MRKTFTKPATFVILLGAIAAGAAALAGSPGSCALSCTRSREAPSPRTPSPGRHS